MFETLASLVLTKWKEFKTPIIIVLAILCAIGCFLFGAYIERLQADAEISDLRRDYAEREAHALWDAETLRNEQKTAFLGEIERLRSVNASIADDVVRVRKQFEQLKAGRDSNGQSSNRNADRCNDLLFEAYGLAGESESLLRDRDARLGSFIKRGE